jgi:hypothetical protein
MFLSDLFKIFWCFFIFKIYVIMVILHIAKRFDNVVDVQCNAKIVLLKDMQKSFKQQLILLPPAIGRYTYKLYKLMVIFPSATCCLCCENYIKYIKSMTIFSVNILGALKIRITKNTNKC